VYSNPTSRERGRETDSIGQKAQPQTDLNTSVQASKLPWWAGTDKRRRLGSGDCAGSISSTIVESVVAGLLRLVPAPPLLMLPPGGALVDAGLLLAVC
jgi:hypothetical protein